MNMTPVACFRPSPSDSRQLWKRLSNFDLVTLSLTSGGWTSSYPLAMS